jgi:hypothetical protein
VIKSGKRPDAGLEQLVHQALVVVDPLGVECARPVGSRRGQEIEKR